MVEGTVKFFNEMKHFGFIAGDDGKEYFVHSSGLKPGVSIKEGDKVAFKPAQGDRGLKAEDVAKAGEASGHHKESHESSHQEDTEE